MRIYRFFFLLVLSFYLYSCTTPQRLPSYFQTITDTTGHGIVVSQAMRIQKGDLLSIQINSKSSLPAKSDVMFNQPVISVPNSNNVSTAGYLVDEEGYIEHHYLGRFKAAGLTKKQLADEIIEKLTVPVVFLAEPSVLIRFLNFRVTVLGEVARSGAITIPGERLTILEAMGLAGDITQFGLKNNIRVIREVDDKRTIGTIDLTSDKLFESPFFNLVQNDVVIVQPSEKKAKAEEQAVVAQKISLALSVATVILAVTNFFISSGK